MKNKTVMFITLSIASIGFLVSAMLDIKSTLTAILITVSFVFYFVSLFYAVKCGIGNRRVVDNEKRN